MRRFVVFLNVTVTDQPKLIVKLCLGFKHKTGMILMGEGFMGGGVQPSFTNFFISNFVLQDTKKCFWQCPQHYLRHLSLTYFTLLMRGRWFSCPSINPEVFFSDILATASRSNTLYGLETLYVQSSRHVRIIEKDLSTSDIFDVIMTCHIFTSFCSYWLRQVS